MKTKVAVLMVCVGLLQTGCRFGNHEVPQESPTPYNGVYITSPKKVAVSATVSGKNMGSVEVDLTLLPKLLTQYITNPVLFVQVDTTTGLSGIAPPSDTKHSLPVILAKDGTLSFSGATSPETFISDPKCQTYLSITEKGALHKDSSLKPPSGSHLPITGKMELEITLTSKFEGTCQPTFEALADCYQDLTLCGGNTLAENTSIQKTVVSAFAPWIDAKVIQPSDISNLTDYSYDVSYDGSL
ncbi:MAG: hypothetical protein HYX41_07070 [Bdellovibrio sp.]|nr:hypothetical protein [Bdellovibrio sp.]